MVTIYSRKHSMRQIRLLILVLSMAACSIQTWRRAAGAPFALAELAFNRIAVNLILTGLLFGGLQCLGIGLGYFRKPS